MEEEREEPDGHAPGRRAPDREPSDRDSSGRRLSSLTLTLGLPEGKRLSLAQANSLGPLLQGALMEHVDRDYAALLHTLQFNPYSQYCVTGKDPGTLAWHVQGLTDEATRRILTPLQSVDAFEVRGAGMRLDVRERAFETTSLKTVLDEIAQNGDTHAHVEFISPTAFKRAGQYVVVPDVRLIFQNLLMQYGRIYEGDGEASVETVDYIESCVRIRSYHLRTQSLQHVSPQAHGVPGFVGDLTLSIRGPQPLRGLVHMLLRFGTHAGVGIKTSMGMGGMRCL